MKHLLNVTVLLLTATGLAGTAQSTPDFAGTWVIESSRTATSGGGSAGGGSMRAGVARAGVAGAGGGARAEIRITQTPSTITIERLGQEPSVKYVYQLDGSESEHVNGRTTTKTTTRWAGRTLVTEGTLVTKLDNGEVRGTIKEVRSFDDEGRLVVETTRTAEGMTSAAPVMTQVYKRK